MKTLFCLLLFITSSLFAETLPKWKLSLDAKKDGGKIRTYQRMMNVQGVHYSIAEMTIFEIPSSQKESTTMIPDALKKAMQLEGFSHTKTKDTERYEGWSPKLRRQVVIHLTTTEKQIKVSSAFYRPFYGRNLALEVELFQRLEHNLTDKKTTSVFHHFFNKIISDAYAAEDCSRCAGNPSCLLLCRSANSGVSGTNSALAGMDLSGIQTELSSSNQQLSALNSSINLGADGIANIAAQAGNIDANINVIGTQANQNWANSNQQADQLNQNLANANQNIVSAQASAQIESDQWQQIVEERSDRALRIGEQMSDPKHVARLSASAAAGAVIGASVANLAVAGIKSAVTFLARWVSGDLARAKDEELVREFNQAMQVYDQSSKLSEELEKRIDNILASMELHARFRLNNSDVLENLQRNIITTGFELEDATACRDADKMIDLNRQLVEYRSLATILDVPNPLQKMCTDLRESFRKLAEIEGMLQNARPNLLKAEAALNNTRARNQNDAAKAIDRLQDGDLYQDVSRSQDRQRRRLYERNLSDTKKLRHDIEDDCEDSFNRLDQKPERKAIRDYCKTLVTQDKNLPQFNLGSAFPALPEASRSQLVQSFNRELIPMGIEKHSTYEQQRTQLFADFERETNRHEAAVSSLRDRISIDPEIALRELTSINAFVERIMTEQAYLYTNGLKGKQRKIEEACAGIEAPTP
ncbi:MAG: hypothetical protein V4598_16575 [Bdellovibrionota bacterium]